MDHVVEAMKSYFEVVLDWFVDEQKTGKYKKLSDNPYYEAVKALTDSMNILRKYLGWDLIKLSDEVKCRMEG